VALISIISFVGIMLAVAVLIIVMSVMNGFRAELLAGSSASTATVYVTGGVLDGPSATRRAAHPQACPASSRPPDHRGPGHRHGPEPDLRRHGPRPRPTDLAAPDRRRQHHQGSLRASAQATTAATSSWWATAGRAWACGPATR
jgi:hypothetical protein